MASFYVIALLRSGFRYSLEKGKRMLGRTSNGFMDTNNLFGIWVAAWPTKNLISDIQNSNISPVYGLSYSFTQLRNGDIFTLGSERSAPRCIHNLSDASERLACLLFRFLELNYENHYPLEAKNQFTHGFSRVPTDAEPEPVDAEILC